MAGIQRFEDIDAWKKARELVREVYRACGNEPFSRDFGLKNQICRAAVSCMANIAEGFGRHGNREFARFLDIAKASTIEVQSLLYVALDLDYIRNEEFRVLYQMAEDCASLIGGFISFLRKPASPRSSGSAGTGSGTRAHGSPHSAPKTQNSAPRTQNSAPRTQDGTQRS